jgi:hypothetical protein
MDNDCKSRQDTASRAEKMKVEIRILRMRQAGILREREGERERERAIGDP